MQKILKLAIVMPICFALCQFFWQVLPLDKLPDNIHLILNDATGPAFLLSAFIGLSCVFLWKIPIINKIIHLLFDTNIYLEGAWKGVLDYTWKGEKRSKDAYLVIKQPNAFALHVWLVTDERISVSKSAYIDNYNGTYQLSYEYSTEDSSDNKIINPLHSGFCTLTLNNKIINGCYYTSRKTAGKMIFSFRNKSTVTNYSLLTKLFNQQPRRKRRGIKPSAQIKSDAKVLFILRIALFLGRVSYLIIFVYPLHCSKEYYLSKRLFKIQDYGYLE